MCLKLFKAFCTKYKHVFCYGAGEYGRLVCCFLDEHDITMDGFVVTKIESNPRVLLEKPVYEINAVNLDNSAFIVATGPRYQNEIVDVLQDMGVKTYFQVTGDLLVELEAATQYGREYPSNRYVNVLLYHRINNLPTDPQLLAVTPQHFEEHVKYLQDNYSILRFEDNWTNVKEKSIVITFDDGYADNYKYALPILEKYHVPATIFVSTENMDTNNEFWWDDLERLFLLNHNLPDHIVMFGHEHSLRTPLEVRSCYDKLHPIFKSMDWVERKKILQKLTRMLHPSVPLRNNNRMLTSNELIEMDKSPWITIGGHTVSHTQLYGESVERQRWEIMESKQKIENILQHRLMTFSYPFGGKADYNADTISLLEQAGYQKAAANYPGTFGDGDGFFEVPRNLVRDWDVNVFAKNVRKAWLIR